MQHSTRLVSVLIKFTLMLGLLLPGIAVNAQNQAKTTEADPQRYLALMLLNLTNADNREHLETVIKAVSDAPTPRRMFFQAFISLLKLHNKSETQQDFARICDENIQLSIKNWHKLPRRITNAHIGLLQNFQQLVELHDASVICQSLALTKRVFSYYACIQEAV